MSKPIPDRKVVLLTDEAVARRFIESLVDFLSTTIVLPADDESPSEADEAPS